MLNNQLNIHKPLIFFYKENRKIVIEKHFYWQWSLYHMPHLNNENTHKSNENEIYCVKILEQLKFISLIQIFICFCTLNIIIKYDFIFLS